MIGNKMVDYSQFGEYTRFIKPMFGYFGTRNKMLLDIGASGRALSNSYNLMAEYGFGGVFIEPVNIERVQKEIIDVFPGRASLDTRAVSLTTGTAQIHLHSIEEQHSLISTWYPPTATDKTLEVETVQISDLLAYWKIPTNIDFLTIDVEGIDADIVQEMLAKSDCRPNVLLFEYLYLDTKKVDATISNLHSFGYTTMFKNNANIGFVFDGFGRELPDTAMRHVLSYDWGLL